MRSIARAATVALLGTISAFSLSGTASAQPINDDISAAVVVSGLPFMHTVSTTEATVAADDPASCFGPLATVWYTFRPSQDVEFAFDTVGSDYITTLEVYSGAPGSLEFVTCGGGAEDRDSAVKFTATAGTQYFVVVGTTCCEGPTFGGNLVVNAYVAPPALTLDLVVDARHVVSKSGTVTITGTLTCSNPAEAFLTVDPLTQRLGRFRAEGRNSIEVACGPSATAWSVDVSSLTGVVFGAGKAQVTAHAGACDLFLTCDEDQVQRAVHLRRG